MKLKPGFQLVDVADEYMIIPVGEETDSFNGIIALNEESYFLLQRMKDNSTVEELSNILMKEYDVDIDTAKSSVKLFIQKMLQYGVIEA